MRLVVCRQCSIGALFGGAWIFARLGQIWLSKQLYESWSKV